MPHTLLLADDSVTIQRVIELTFADEDITVVAVSDGDQAIQRLAVSPPPDIVLADIGMPGKNGYEVAQYIRQTPKLSHIPVVLLTGAFEPVDQARAAEAGCDGVLAKPFEPQLVIGRVKDLLAKGRSGAISPEATAVASSPAPTDEQPVLPEEPAFTAPAPAAAQAATAEQEPAAAQAGAAQPLDDYFDRLDAAFSSLSSPSTPSTASPEPVMAPPAAPAAPLGAVEIDWFSAASAPGAEPEPWDLPAPVAAAAAPDLPLSYAPPEPEAPPFSSAAHAAASSAPAAPSAPDEADADTIVTPAPALVAAPAAVPAPIAARAPGIAPTPDVARPPDVAPAAPAVASRPASLPPVAATALPSLGEAFAALLAAEQHDGSPSPAWPGAIAAPPPAITDAVIDDVVRRVLERMSDRVVRDTTAGLVSHVAERLVREEIEKIRASIK